MTGKKQGGPRRSDGIRTAADLMDRCTVDEVTKCWTWRGGKNSHGTPAMWCPALGDGVSLGVMTAVLRTGARPPKGTEWYSVCGFANCANPSHRKPGTRSDMMMARNIMRTPAQIARITAGKRKAAKLSDADVVAIRHSDMALPELAARFAISIQYCCDVRSGKRRVDLAAPGSSVFAWRPA